MLLDVGGTTTAGCGTATEDCGPAGGGPGGLSLLLLLTGGKGESDRGGIDSSSTLMLVLELRFAGTAGGAGGCCGGALETVTGGC